MNTEQLAKNAIEIEQLRLRIERDAGFYRSCLGSPQALTFSPSRRTVMAYFGNAINRSADRADALKRECDIILKAGRNGRLA